MNSCVALVNGFLVANPRIDDGIGYSTMHDINEHATGTGDDVHRIGNANPMGGTQPGSGSAHDLDIKSIAGINIGTNTTNANNANGTSTEDIEPPCVVAEANSLERVCNKPKRIRLCASNSGRRRGRPKKTQLQSQAKDEIKLDKSKEECTKQIIDESSNDICMFCIRL